MFIYLKCIGKLKLIEITGEFSKVAGQNVSNSKTPVLLQTGGFIMEGLKACLCHLLLISSAANVGWWACHPQRCW